MAQKTVQELLADPAFKAKADQFKEDYKVNNQQEITNFIARNKQAFDSNPDVDQARFKFQFPKDNSILQNERDAYAWNMVIEENKFCLSLLADRPNLFSKISIADEPAKDYWEVTVWMQKRI